jgi:hypothetical protein
VEAVVERAGHRRVARRAIAWDEAGWRRLYPAAKVKGRRRE